MQTDLFAKVSTPKRAIEANSGHRISITAGGRGGGAKFQLAQYRGNKAYGPRSAAGITAMPSARR